MERIFRVGLVVAVLGFIGLALFLETLPTGGQVVSGPGGGTTSSSAETFWNTNATAGGITNTSGLLTLNGHATIGTAGQASFADGGVLINVDGRLDAVSLTVSDVHFLNLDGSAHLGDEALVISAAGNVTAAHNLTLSGLTASRLVLTDGSKVLTSAAASGAVPVNADGSETTAALVNALFPGNVLTNGESVSTVFSNSLSVDAAHSLSVSNKIGVYMGPAANAGVYGLDLTNNATASSGNQEYSPFLHFAGNGWKTTATAASQPVEFAMGVVPIQGSANPTSALIISNSVNNAAWSESIRILSGNPTIASESSSSLSIHSGSGQALYLGNNSATFGGNIRIDNTQLKLKSTYSFAWSSDSTSFGTADLILNRDAAATLQLGDDAATPTAQVIKGPDGSGTDKTGGDMTFAGGKSTGTGRGGAVQLQTSPSATTGSSANTLQTRVYISAKDTALTDATATTVATFTLANSKYCGLKVSATSHADNGTDFQATSDFFSVGLVNKAGTVTVGTLSTVTTSTGASTGTLPTTWTVTASGTTVSVKVSADTSFASPTTFGCKWRLEIDSDDTALVVAAQ